MFQFPASAPTISRRRVFNPPGFPIRTSPDQFLFADPRSFSQLTTSFIASGSQGILRSLLFSFSYFSSEYIATFTSQFLLVCLMKLQSHIRNSKKLEFVIQTIISLTSFTSLSLSVLSMISQIPPQKYPSSEGTAKVHTFFELTNLFGKFFKKIDPGSPPGMRDGPSSPTRSGIPWPRYRPLSSQPPAKLPGVDSFSPKIGSTLPN